ncbi:membrane protein [Vibrio sp. MACH09]|uniref:YfgM family protein n=1 Tax=Vibrio sp. MACH09 TaxID=3025122 RepID=UPI00279370D4|nr:tetratricopeptide repeat protein [Vibrio sp. MACH09]GLO60046.1 membrane protein [Vibrio sp. MACH09]
MELYDSEEQQVEAIKDWWKENGKAVILGGVVGLGGIFGWRYYQDSVVAAKDAASDSYTKVISQLSSAGSDASDEVQSYIDANKETEYAVLAALQLARVQVEANDIPAALAQLEWAKANTKDETVKPLIDFRIARVFAQQQQFDQAIAQLSAITSSAWQGRVNELKGDILLRKGDKEGAYSAYVEAQQAGDANQGIQLKLDDLAK